MFLVKRRIKRLWCVFCVFFVFKRLENGVKNVQEESRTQGDFLFLVWRRLGPFKAPAWFTRRRPLLGCRWPPSKGLKSSWSWHPWKDLDFLFLKRYGTWKSNSQIKSYGSRKLAVHQSARYLGFHDISAVLTPISTHE